VKWVDDCLEQKSTERKLIRFRHPH
jgi:hypothetical protein